MQSFLMAVITIGLGIVGNTVGNIYETQQAQGTSLTSLNERQQFIMERVENLSIDRYTGTQAAVDRAQVNDAIDQIRGSISIMEERVRALEMEAARRGEQ